MSKERGQWWRDIAGVLPALDEDAAAAVTVVDAALGQEASRWAATRVAAAGGGPVVSGVRRSAAP